MQAGLSAGGNPERRPQLESPPRGRRAGLAGRLSRARRFRGAGASRGFEFQAFCAFYMVAFLLDATEEWEPPLPALAFLIGVALVYARGIRRWSFFGFLVASSAYILIVHFPDPGNHNNIFLLCNLFLIGGILYAARRREAFRSDNALLEWLKPPLRITLSLVYIFAGFHKLNSGFFDEQAGCAQSFFTRMWELTPLPEASLSGPALIAFGASVIVWELGGGLMLWLPRTQPVMLVMCWIGHGILAELQFFDFSSLAFALLLLFIPSAYWRVLERGSQLRIGPVRTDRLTLYVFINIGVAALAGAYFQLFGLWQGFHKLQGLGLNVALLVFVWPILRQLLRGSPRIAWSGIPMWPAGGLRWGAAVLPAFVIFFALNPYLGLRTAGTFTMFSNLQIEAERSNHLLLGSNPLKLWSVQEDWVQIHEIDPRHATRDEEVLTGNLLPVVEFQKRIIDWREEEGLRDLSATFEYDGRVYETEDLLVDNPWQVEAYSPVHYLLDFRLVQLSDPIACRW